LAQYLTVDDICRINEAEVGPNLLADFGLVESAVLRPQSTIGGQDAYPDIHRKAAALFHSLVSNHAFLDGNKRTAVLAVIAFFNLNGWSLRADQGDLVNFAVWVAELHPSVEGIAEWLAERTAPLDLPQE
jgi:death-on-curing protein